VLLNQLVVTGCALWLAAHVVGGVQLANGCDPLATVGTALLVALLLAVVHALSRGPRRAVALAVGTAPLPIVVAVLVIVNAMVFWLAVTLAAAVGLRYQVDGFLPALLGSLVVTLVGWLGRLGLTESGTRS
jgi:putative membrane protein